MQKNHLIVTTLDVGDQKLARLGLKNWPFKKKTFVRLKPTAAGKSGKVQKKLSNSLANCCWLIFSSFFCWFEEI
jgi:hypothetical protein